MAKKSLSVFDVLDRGSIVCGDEENETIVATSRDGLDLYRYDPDAAGWQFATSKEHDGLDGLTFEEIYDLATTWLEELSEPESQDGDEEFDAEKTLKCE
jgi:hypothetical protein